MSFDMHIPGHWRWATIAEVQSSEKRSTITGPFGSSIGKKFFVEHGVPVIRGNNLSLGSTKFKDEGFVFVSEDKAEELRGYKAFKYDLIFTAAGTIGQVGIIPGNTKYECYIISNKQMRARFDTDKVDPMFAYYWFSSPWMVDYIKRHDTGSTIPLINLGVLRSLPMPLPPVVEQVAIRQYLFMIDEKINNNNKINQTLEQMAQALFKSWFVDFEPVKAKMAVLETGGSQEDATFAAMTAISGKDTDTLAVFEREHPEQYAELKTTAELFPSAMQESELGAIPAGWNISNIKDNVDVRDGTHASPKASDSGYHLVTSKNITSGYLDRRSCYYISDMDYHEVNKRSRVSCGDILISMIGTVGALYFVAENNVDYAIKNIGLIRTSERQDLQAFIFYHLKSNNGVNYINSRLAGTTQKYLSLKQLREIPIVMPTQDVLAAFNKKIFLHEIHANQEITETLANIRDTLLPKLLSGEITLPEAEQAVSEAENV